MFIYQSENLSIKMMSDHFASLQGVHSYVETAEVLHRYRHMPSFDAIHHDCEAALGRLNASLKEQLALKEVSSDWLTCHHLFILVVII